MLLPGAACTLLDPNNGASDLLNGLDGPFPAPPSSRSRFLCLQCLSYRMPNSTTKYSTSARNTNSVHDISHTSMHFSSSALGELFLRAEKKCLDQDLPTRDLFDIYLYTLEIYLGLRINVWFFKKSTMRIVYLQPAQLGSVFRFFSRDEGRARQK